MIRGNTRLEFVCGLRALHQARTDFRTLQELSRQLSAPASETPGLVAAQLGKPYGLRPEGDPLLDSEPEFDVAVSVDCLRQRVSRVDALATAAERFFEEMPWGGKRQRGRRQLERVAHLVGATIEAVRVAVADGDRLARKLAAR